MSILVGVGCNKNNKENSYGVSISAPKMVGSAAEVFSNEDINTLRFSNSLTFLLLNQSVKVDEKGIMPSFSFSSLQLIHYIYSIEDTNYLKSFDTHFAIEDRKALFENITRIDSLIKGIDSSIKAYNSLTELSPKKIAFSQSFAIPLIYEGALNQEKLPFMIDDKEIPIEYFTLTERLGLIDNKDVLGIDIPIGNGNYSLLIIQPKEISIKDFISNFSEKDYKDIVDNLSLQTLRVRFPNLSNSCDYALFLPNIPSEQSPNPTFIQINSEVKILKPTSAELQLMKKDLDSELKASTKTETYLFNKPFLYIIRGKNSNSILLIGGFIGSESR
jgi:hypothetical protein